MCTNKLKDSCEIGNLLEIKSFQNLWKKIEYLNGLKYMYFYWGVVDYVF